MRRHANGVACWTTSEYHLWDICLPFNRRPHRPVRVLPAPWTGGRFPVRHILPTAIISALCGTTTMIMRSSVFSLPLAIFCLAFHVSLVASHPLSNHPVYGSPPISAVEVHEFADRLNGVSWPPSRKNEVRVLHPWAIYHGKPMQG